MYIHCFSCDMTEETQSTPTIFFLQEAVLYIDLAQAGNMIQLVYWPTIFLCTVYVGFNQFGVYTVYIYIYV